MKKALIKGFLLLYNGFSATIVSEKLKYWGDKMSYDLFEQGPAVYIPYMLLLILLTAILYGIIPLIIAMVRKKKITKKK